MLICCHSGVKNPRLKQAKLYLEVKIDLILEISNLDVKFWLTRIIITVSLGIVITALEGVRSKTLIDNATTKIAIPQAIVPTQTENTKLIKGLCDIAA